MTGYNSPLGHRLRKLETKTKPVTLVSGIRIVAWNEADKEKQIAELLAAGRITPDMLIICRMIVSCGGPGEKIGSARRRAGTSPILSHQDPWRPQRVYRRRASGRAQFHFHPASAEAATKGLKCLSIAYS